MTQVGAGTGNSLSVSPVEIEVEKGDEFAVEIMISAEQELHSAQFMMSWKGSGQIICTGIDEGTFFDEYGSTQPFGGDYDNSGTIEAYSVAILGDPRPSGEGVLAVVHFEAQKDGEVDLKLIDTIFWSDAAGDIFTDEVNNGRVIIGGAVSDEPELEIEEVSSEWVTENESYKVSYVVKNRGGESADAFTVGLYIDGADNPEITERVNGLAAGDTYDGTFDDYEIEITDEMDELELVADIEGEVTESDKDNNSYESTWPGSDLVISNLSVQWLEEGSTYELSFTVENTGVGDVSTSILSISIDGEQLTTMSCPNIDAGETYKQTYGPVTLSDGKDTIEVCADYEDRINEADEDNNCMQAEWPDKGQPGGQTDEDPSEDKEGIDLSVSDYSVEWNEESTGYVISYSVENDGTENTGAFTVELYVDDSTEPVATETVMALNTRDSYEGSFDGYTIILSDEEDTIKICVDSANEISEINENNNSEQFVVDLSSVSEGKQIFPQVPETRPPTPGITISWEYISGIIGMVFLVGLLGFALGRR
jgi:subtilase family serine protease